MDVLKTAREMCQQLTKDERFINYMNARKANDEDESLQQDIGEFNLIRLSLDKELSAEEKNEEKINNLNNKIRDIYSKIMANEVMINYNDSKLALDDLIAQINTIISKTCAGEDPLTCDAGSGCSGSCATCGGCH